MKATFDASLQLYRWASLCSRHLRRPFNPKHLRGGIMAAHKVSFPQVPGNIPTPGTAGWGQYQSCLQQYLSVLPQQSAQIAPILANEGRKVIAIRNNNSLSNVQKMQAIKAMHQQFDQQLKAILSSAQYDKLKVGRQQAMRWATQARLGWQ